MPIFLQHRNSGLKEKMDDPDCDLETLYATYRQFTTMNRLIGGWKSIYKKQIRPALIASGDKASLLDIGCGGGDILRMLHKFAGEDGLNVHFTGIEPDQRAINYTMQQNWPENIDIKKADSAELVSQRQHFTVVISNHLLHHLTAEELSSICRDAEFLADRLILFSDIERSDIGYTFFRIFSPVFFKNSFIAEDGMTSIRRSYRKKELLQHLHENWAVKRKFPFRLLAINNVQVNE